MDVLLDGKSISDLTKRAPSTAADGDGGDLDAAVDKVCYYSISILMYYIRIVP
jgi:hypothetical protein